MKKRLIFILLLIILFSTFSNLVYSATITPKSVTVEKGEEFSTSFNLSGAVGMAGCLVELEWDNSILDVTEISSGLVFSKGTFIKNINYDNAVIMWYNTTNIVSNGEAFSLKAKVRDNVSNGSYIIKATISNTDTINENGEMVDVSINNVNVTVKSEAVSSGRSSGRVSAGTKVAEIVADNTTGNKQIIFDDVKNEDYYFEAVNWATLNNITSGISDRLFAPQETCTRAQALTFMWRNAGATEPTIETVQFEDVKKSDYFYKAIMWALENDITFGTSPTTFSPNNILTRGQLVTFLWRNSGKKETNVQTNFIDVKSEDYFSKAISWAVEKGITLGTSDTEFSPNEPCTRGQTVTFLYRLKKAL